jgi:hypothetical protein
MVLPPVKGSIDTGEGALITSFRKGDWPKDVLERVKGLGGSASAGE